MLQAQTAPGGKVIAFRPQALGVRRDPDESGSERGRILLFTGVRYQRMDDTADAGEFSDATRAAGGHDSTD